MAKVFFKTGTQADYAALGTPSDDTLYYLTDVRKMYKGANDYTASVRVVAAGSFPTSDQAQGILYVDTTNKVGKIWSGTVWVDLFAPTAVVNDLTTGGTTSALSAEQGKTLKTGLDLKAPLASPTFTGTVGGITKSMVGLTNVNDTSDANKPVSTAQQTALNLKANLANPTFTGTVSLPTSAPTADTQAAHKKYVDDQDTTTLNAAKTYADGIIGANDAMVFKGTLGTGGTITALPTTYSVGWSYKVITAGTYAGHVCQFGDLMIAIADRAGVGNDTLDWIVAQTNIDGAVVGPASATDDTLVLFNGTTGKIIKGSSVTITSLNTAVTDAHTHSNKATLDTYTQTEANLASAVTLKHSHTNKSDLDTYDQTQTELLATAQTAAGGLVTTHAAVAGTAAVSGHLKLGTVSGTAAEGGHSHALDDLTDVGILTATTNDVLMYTSGTGWGNAALAITDVTGLESALAAKITKVAPAVAGDFPMFVDTTGGLASSGKAATTSVAAIATAADTKIPTEKAVRTAIDEAVTWGTV